MNVTLQVTEYNVTLVPNAASGSGTLNLSTDDIELSFSSAFLTDEGNRIVSPSDQVSVLMSPPTLAIADHAGVPPVRQRIREVVASIAQLLETQGFVVSAFGWNIGGKVNGAEPGAVMGKLINKSEFDAAISAQGEREWFVPLIHFNTESRVADRVSYALQTVPGDESPELSFIVNAHFESRLPLDEITQAGDNVWGEVESLLVRLVQ